MTGRTRRQAALLAGLLAVLIAIVALQPGADDPAAPGQRSSNAQRRGGGEAMPDAPVVDLGLERLHGTRDPLPDTDRNPFRFRPAPAPPPPAAVLRPAPPPREFGPPVPTGPPPPPPIPIKFFGLVVLRGDRVAAFSDTRGNTFYGREGDIIEGRYRVLRIGTDAVELAYLDGRGRQTIRLTGQ
jgi:hypothetical protein